MKNIQKTFISIALASTTLASGAIADTYFGADMPAISFAQYSYDNSDEKLENFKSISNLLLGANGFVGYRLENNLAFELFAGTNFTSDQQKSIYLLNANNIHVNLAYIEECVNNQDKLEKDKKFKEKIQDLKNNGLDIPLSNSKKQQINSAKHDYRFSIRYLAQFRGLYNFGITDAIDFNVGLGLGMAGVDLELTRLDQNQKSLSNKKDNDNNPAPSSISHNLATSGIIGVNYAVTNNVKIGLEYSFTHLGSVTAHLEPIKDILIADRGVFGNLLNKLGLNHDLVEQGLKKKGIDFNAHLDMAGLKAKLDQENECTHKHKINLFNHKISLRVQYDL